MNSRIVFAPLRIPVDESVHTLNFQRIVSTLKFVSSLMSAADDSSNGSHVFFYFAYNDSDDNNNKSILKQFLLIEYIAQYYSEIVSSPKHMLPKSSVIVLPFPNATIFSSYVTYQMDRLGASVLNHIQFQSEGLTTSESTVNNAGNQSIANTVVELEPENIEWKSFYPYHIQEAKSALYGKYKVVCLGGTFDRLHVGHQLMLTCLAMILDTDDQDARFVIGLSGDALLQNKELKELIQPYSLRRDNMIHMLKTVHPGVFSHSNNNNMFQISELTDPYGPSTAVAEIEALVISEETRRGGESVNRVRVEKGMKPSDLICIPVVQARNNAEKLSSTQLRRDEKAPCS